MLKYFYSRHCSIWFEGYFMFKCLCLWICEMYFIAELCNIIINMVVEVHYKLYSATLMFVSENEGIFILPLLCRVYTYYCGILIE